MHLNQNNRFVSFIKSISLSAWFLILILLLVIASLGYVAWYGYKHLVALEDKLNSQNIELRNSLSETASLMEASIAEVENLLGNKLEEERGRLASLQNKLSNFQNEVVNISSSVTNLEKLTQTDKELLQKYSRVFFLNEHYMPEDVVEIPNKYKYYEQRNYVIHTKVYPYLENMIKAAKDDGVELYVYSAYRSFDEQSALKSQYKVIYGEGTANQFSADQGYSEHQLGSTVDLITTGIGGSLDGFKNTEAYEWLLNNAHKFGFTLSYPENNNYYIFEPWHWRFVGKKLAAYLFNNDKHFYDLSQREIDEYLVTIFD